MAYTPLRISISEPCHEDWDRMTPLGDNRRHCASCEKAVTDFSWMTDREIHQYLAVAGNKLCGRFRRDQLDRPVRAHVKPSTGWRAAAAAGGLLLSAGAAAQVPGADVPKDQEPAYTELSEIINGDVEREARMKGTFRGVVTDEEGAPLIGVTILIKGTTTGTVTDFDGGFELTVKAGQVLQLTYIGYEDLDYPVERDDSGFEAPKMLEVKMSDQALAGEIIIVGACYVDYSEPDTAFFAFSQRDTVAVKEKTAPGINVSPNPFTDRLNVAFPAEVAGTLSAQLWHVNGQMIRKWQPQQHEAGRARIELPLGDTPLVPGHYILRLTDQDGNVTSQIVLHQ
ncbi:putative secreted protein (Por secretion system target) [Neolewinella xylanilytica]|uniref:Putative secreted protein (Por secretion system target) n=1 Tax=Neolewinella xylanilytica TaxID=1514080 RepID=A0A2S6I1U3_9BACT|nr:carboxypeptidase-like regulatory domain-containing protein [Neolewinella xylanilytica]PPK85146.1 putative secreted protein (Por secretion system target) [Neolewinella xylanilytica]